jgi:aspartate kinase
MVTLSTLFRAAKLFLVPRGSYSRTRPSAAAEPEGAVVPSIGLLTEPVQRKPFKEEAEISGLSVDGPVAEITVAGSPGGADRVAAVLLALAEAGTGVDMFSESGPMPGDGMRDIMFTSPVRDRPRAMDALRRRRTSIGFSGLRYRDDAAKLSLTGIGLRSTPTIVPDFVATLSAAGIPTGPISVSDFCLAVVIPAARVTEAIDALDAGLHLGRRTA